MVADRTAPEPSDFKVDLDNCDREPIHVLGNIQSFGFLITLTSDWLISRVSENSEAFLGKTPQQLIGQPISLFFNEHAVHAIRNRLSMLRGPDSVERLFNLQLLPNSANNFDVAMHFSGDAVVIEAEPAQTEDLEAAAMVRAMMSRLGQSETMAAFLREGARQVRALTGFERVMVYRFDREGSGEVVAEALRPGIDSFMGLHYPASDIPAQARALYTRNVFRIIADVGAKPVGIVPRLDPRGQALDQSLSVLRAVSPIHIEYLTNMGVQASLSISIVVGGKLWGLFACHHYAPRLPSFAHRSAAELFGQMFSMTLESRERREAADYETRARSVADRLMASVAQDNALLHDAPWLGEIIFDTIPADGVGVFLDGTLSLSGLTPSNKQFENIIPMLNRVAGSQVFATDCISAILPEAEAYSDRAAGLLAIPLSRKPRDYVVLFRTERLHSVRWAGNPEKAVEFGPNGARLTPRKSFEEWSQLVKGKALPFTSPERRVAETLRTALLEVVLRLSDSASEDRQRANDRQELLIAELNHRVRNILALIRGLISQSRNSSLSAADFVATLDDRIQSLARAHDQITADRWGPGRLTDLITTEAGAYLGKKRQRVTAKGPNVLIEPAAFTTLALVFHEMLTNAAKYGALSDNGSVAIDWHLDEDGSLLIHWAERGGPAVTAPTRRGFGSTIIERSIPYDLGGHAEVHYRLSGLQADFCVPSRHVNGVLPDALTEHKQKPATLAAKQPLGGKRVLLVEDSMIIALDAEDALRALGAADVVTAATVERALGVLEGEKIDFALLDFNLNAETSLPIADKLDALGTSYLFATGYGDDLDLPDNRSPGVVVKKPYGLDSLAAALAKKG